MSPQQEGWSHRAGGWTWKQAAWGQRLHVSSWGGKAMRPWWRDATLLRVLKGGVYIYILSLLALTGDEEELVVSHCGVLPQVGRELRSFL